MKEAAGREERVRWWRPPALPGVEILEAENCAHHWKVFHHTYSICQIWDIPGQNDFTKWRYRKQEVVSRRGDLMLMEPGEIHVTERLGGPGTFWVLLMDPEAFADLVKREFLPGMPRLKFATTHQPEFCAAMAALYAALTHSTSQLEKEERFAEVKRLLVEKASERPENRWEECDIGALGRAKEYVRAHFLREIRLDELAKAACVHPCHLARLFRKHFGMRPKEYQAVLRVEEVKKQLVSGRHLSSVEAGFCSSSHLIRVFQTLTRVSPTDYKMGRHRIWPGSWAQAVA